MAEIEHFLKQDWRFKGFVQGLERVDPGQERDDWYAKFIRGVYSWGYHKDAKFMIDHRAYQPASTLPCMMKIVRIPKLYQMNMKIYEKSGKQAFSIPFAEDGYPDL
jgi:hypothetical protein